MITNYCPICGELVFKKRKFCSVKCKSESQNQKIELECTGCGNHFRILPYLQRKSNYCSVSCYHDSTRKKEIKNCPVCRKNFSVMACLVKKGFGIYCSQKCRYKIHRKTQVCYRCGKEFTRALSLSIKYTKSFCSKKCCDDSTREYVSISCRNCQKMISIPRSTINRGKGGFCSWYCYIHYKGETSIEKIVRIRLKKAKIPFEQEVKIGKYHSDFMIQNTNILIECDGDYWHGLPSAIAKDKVRDLILRTKGYEVLRFTETEIKKTKGNCVINQLSQRTDVKQ
ncbi:MAG: Protein containing DUF559 [Candidatus Collierbacteria bacterium GW2011_GWA2_44_99]|uniref:Protein containing DUF559 n=2 Tax=Candidatus Collieribacteriota TaxID=1752725 RepID=A0A0G1MW22_9BACT|nr:MAG: Protein containing DUF559 [Candidatus Collierbacteria bacterium GW2011_GWA2_44_99]